MLENVETVLLAVHAQLNCSRGQRADVDGGLTAKARLEAARAR